MRKLCKFVAGLAAACLMIPSLSASAVFAAASARADDGILMTAHLSSDNELEVDPFVGEEPPVEEPPVEDPVQGPVIALTDVPAYGEIRPIRGQVFMEDGSGFDPADYRISLFLQITADMNPIVKPTLAEPYVNLDGDGSFTGVFITGGVDEQARLIHVMLVPADVTPANFSDTRAAALDYVLITRTEAGDVTVSPVREAPAPASEASPAIYALDTVSENKLAVDVGFYTDGSWPGSPLGEDLIRAQLEAVSAFADTVRFYGAGGELEKAYAIAHEMGLSVVGTACLTGNAAADEAEMDALIDHVNKGYAQVACVGNETLLTGALTEGELIEAIRYVRSGLTDETVPVTTSDSVDVLIESPALRDACNLLMPNIYPFWGGVALENASQAFIASVDMLKAVSGGKQVLVSETGWPTAGSATGKALPGEENAARYFDAIRSYSLSTGTQVLYFSAADEPWKTNEGDVGPNWGFLTNEFVLKTGYRGSAFFKANPLTTDLGDAVISNLKNRTYTGKAITQTPSVMLGEVTLTEGIDYTVAYADNKNAGTARVTITGIGTYTGTVTAAFKINKASQTLSVKASSGKVAVGKAVTLTVDGAKGPLSFKSAASSVAKVSSAGKVTGKGVGTVVITVTSGATTNYKAASKNVTVKVLPAATTSLKAANQSTGVKLTWARVDGANGYLVYRDGTKIATVSGGATVSCTDKKAAANGKKYQYKLVAKGATGTSTLSKTVTTYCVLRPAISSVKNNASKKMTVKWKANKKASSYQLQYSTDKSFKTGVKKVTVKEAATVSKVISGLKKGKTYYVRLRTCKTVSGTNYTSAFSAVKSVKIAK